MKKITTMIFLLLVSFSVGISQSQDNILITIDGKDISRNEFMHIYKKNNQNIQSGDKTGIDDYLDMFINFKLKVIEAENLGIDTIPSVKNEIEKYRHELAKPYLVDSQVLQNLLQEAYERSKKEIRASHILIKFPQKISYEDTLLSYEKVLGIRRRIVNKEEPFIEVAKATSDDPSVKNNGGDLGYFSAFRMVYPFENAAYKLDIDEVSNPVRTQFGYHLIKKTDVRDAKGQVKVAHIMLLAPKSMKEEEKIKKKEKINNIYQKLKDGANFAELAKEYSDDKGSASNGGELPWFGTGRMVPAFEEAAFSLDETGEITQPVRTSVGWHIIKLLNKKELGPFEEEKNAIKQKVQNNPRYQVAGDSLISDLKKDYGYSLDSASMLKIHDIVLDEEENYYPNRIQSLKNNKTPLFQFAGKKFTIGDFISFLDNPPRELTNNYKNKYLFDKAYHRYVDNQIIKYEKSLLKEKHKEYKYLVNEYHDGILLFEIMDRKVWTKASEDTTGLKNYYQENKENYKWGERYKGKIYLFDTKDTKEKVQKMKKGGLFRKSYSDEEILNELNINGKQKVKINEKIFRKGENPVIDYHVWNIGTEKDIDDKKPYWIKGKIVPPTIKTLNEARGEVIADYQNYLEKQWIDELRDKYDIHIKEKVLQTLKEKTSHQ